MSLNKILKPIKYKVNILSFLCQKEKICTTNKATIELKRVNSKNKLMNPYSFGHQVLL